MTVIPRWLELQSEIDYRIWLLNEMRRELWDALAENPEDQA